jgi:signal transduction histidine kinase/CheY-like chemotaxis protein
LSLRLNIFLPILLILILSPQVIFTQSQDDIFSKQEIVGLPLIKNYLTSDYNATPQNWAIVKDKRGIMYFANTGGVLEYDGVSWRIIEIKNEVVRTLAIDEDGIIYVGGIDEFGYLSPDSTGKMEYTSLISLLPEDDKEFGDIWSIWPSGRGVFFQSTSHLFLLKDPVASLKGKNRINLKSWKAKTIFNPAFLVNENYFIPETGIGLLSLEGDSLKVVAGGEQFANETIYDMLDFSAPGKNKSEEGKILIGTGENGFFIYNGKHFTKFITEADEYVQKNKLYFRGAVLANNIYAFGTQTGGLILINSSGKLLRVINKKNGLSDNTIWFIYPDSSGILWLGLNNGIARIIYPSPISLIDSRFGIDGVIFSVNEHNGTLYLSTPNGVYCSSNLSDNKINSVFRLINGINSESWEILNLDDHQLVATTHGVFNIENNKATRINTKWRFAYSFCKSKVNPKVIYVGLHDGLAKLLFVNGEWTDGGKIPGVSEIITQIEEDRDGTLWLSSYNKGILKITTNNAGSNASYTISRYTNVLPGKQFPFITFGDKMIFGTANGLMSFDKDKNSFYPDSVFGKHFLGGFRVTDIKKDISGNVWIAGSKKNNPEIGRIVFDKKGYKWESFPQLKLILENIPTFSPHKLFPDHFNKNLLWITQGEKLYRFNINQAVNYQSKQNFIAVIRSVNINGDSIIYAGGFNPADLQKPGKVWKLYAGLNSIEFNYSSSSYFKEGSSKYRFLLEGFDSQWSDWTYETRKEYTNLSSGTYQFKVQAMDILGELSNETSITFDIPTPWYKSVWATLLLSLLLIYGIWWAVNLRIRILEKRTIELEAIVDKRTNEVRKQKDTLEEQARKLLELDRLKSNFFANISHEFRTPLTLIMGQIENLLGSSPEAVTQKKLKTALSNSRQLQALINRLLELSKLESGELKMKVSYTELNSLLRKILSAFESLTDRQNIKLEFNRYEEDIYIYIDREKIEEVFNNLISNAIKFTPENGKISLSISFENNQKEYVSILVADTGIGIRQEDLEHVFDRFYQVDSSETREYEGTGIGLAIVKELLQLHKGTISVSSAPGKGTQFRVQLPAGKEQYLNEPNVEIVEGSKEIIKNELDTDFIIPSADQDKEETDEEDSTKEVILVVEDNFDMRGYIKENLEQNYKVIEAKNGEEGVRKAFTSIPDLILTDVMMPAMNGFELTGKLKTDNKTSHIPIIMLTAKADEESKLKGLDIGVDDYLIKPFSTKELHARVGNLIKLRRLLKEKYKEISAINPSEIDAKPIDREFLAKVFSIIKDHLEDPGFTVTILAEVVGMSVSQLNRKLNGTINQSAGKLIRSTKLDYASQLLKSKAGNITEVAYKIGFSDTPSFTHSFKEKFGCTPSEYLKANK